MIDQPDRQESSDSETTFNRISILILVVGGLILVASVLFLPRPIVDRDLGGKTRQLSGPELASAVNDVRATLLQAVAGIVVAVGAVSAWRQVRLARDQLQSSRARDREEMRLTREGQNTERFSRAIDQLSSEKIDLRLGGLHSLGRLALISETDRAAIGEIISAWIRRQTPPPPDNENAWNAADALRVRAPDVQIALDVLKEIPPSNEYYPRLYLADLRRATLEGADLRRADLRGANMRQADLRNAQLQGAHLDGADLSRALMHDADLTEATLPNAVLNEVNFERLGMLHRSDLRNAQLRGARLDGVTIIASDFHGAVSSEQTTWPDDFSPAIEGVVVESD